MSKLLESCKDIYEKNEALVAFILFGPFMYSINLYGMDMEVLDDFFTVARVFCFFVILFIFFVLEKKKQSKLTIILFVIECWQLIATCLTNHKIVVAFYDLSSCLSIALLIELFLDDIKKLINVLMLHYELCIYPNLIDIIFRYIKDGGVSEVGSFLGGYTLQILFFIPAIVICFLYAYYNNRKTRSIFLGFATSLSILLLKNVTTFLSCLSIAAILIYGCFIKKSKNISISIIFSLIILLDVFLVFFYGKGDYSFIKNMIEPILHRNLDFTGRIYIWEDEIDLIKNSPIIGNGYRTIFEWVDPWGYGATAGNGHNQLLGRMLSGGIIELLLFLLMHFELFKKVEKLKPNLYKTALISCMTGIFMTYITEDYFKFWRFYIVFFLLYHLDEILMNKEVVKK